MNTKNVLKGFLFATTAIIGSHVAQVYNIESRCEGIRERAIETLNTPQEDFKEGVQYVRSQVPSEREDYLFIVGDFQTADNKHDVEEGRNFYVNTYPKEDLIRIFV